MYIYRDNHFERRTINNDTVRALNHIIHLLRVNPRISDQDLHGYINGEWDGLDRETLAAHPILLRFAQPLYDLVKTFNFAPAFGDGSYENSETVGYPLRNIFDHCEEFERRGTRMSYESLVQEALDDGDIDNVDELGEPGNFLEYFYGVHGPGTQSDILSELFYMLKLLQKAMEHTNNVDNA